LRTAASSRASPGTRRDITSNGRAIPERKRRWIGPGYGYSTGLPAFSAKTEATTQKPLKAAIYTGITYVITVVFLIVPYLFLSSYYLSLGCTLIAVVLIIGIFNFYISVAMDQPFKKRFAEMALLSLSVAGLSFLLGHLLCNLIGVEV
jgi:VIT1/CCC1 family predicted Fe2+/Mn2+ transporter